MNFKSAIVLGEIGGIGKEVCLQLIKRGLKVIWLMWNFKNLEYRTEWRKKHDSNQGRVGIGWCYCKQSRSRRWNKQDNWYKLYSHLYL